MISTQTPRSVRACIFTCILLIFSFNMMKGIRLPNLWSYTNYLFYYSEGFNKRSLIGEIIRQSDLPILKSYFGFTGFAFFIFIICITLLIRMMHRLSAHDNLLSVFVMLAFSSSFGVVYFTHTVGYFDHIGLMITLILISVSSSRLRLALAILLCPIGILVHEAFLILFFPVIAYSVAIGDDVSQKKQFMAIASLTIWVLLIGYIVANSTLSLDAIRLMQQDLQSQTTVQLRADAFDLLARNANDNLSIMSKIWTNAGDWLDLSYSLAGTLPTTIFMIFATYYIAPRERVAISTQIMAIAAALSPLAMHIVAWDKERFNCLTLVTAFLIYYLTASPSKDHTAYPKLVTYRFAIVAIFLSILNFGTDIKLFDGYNAVEFPYRTHIRNILDSLKSGRSMFGIPHEY